MMKGFHIPVNRCLDCGKTLDATAVASTKYKPKTDDITICLYCGHIMAFSANLTVRPLTDQEMHAIAGDKRLVAIQRVRAKVFEKK